MSDAHSGHHPMPIPHPTVQYINAIKACKPTLPYPDSFEEFYVVYPSSILAWAYWVGQFLPWWAD